MEVVSECDLRVGSLLWVPRPSTWALTVVCKATYRLLPGEADLAHVQEDPNEEDNHWDDDADRSLYAVSDLAPRKPRCDVLLVGHAFPPCDAPAPSFSVRLMTASVDKSIEVFRERLLLPTGHVRLGTFASQVPLRYERAAGGPGTVNPVGMRPDARDAHGALPLPPLQRPGCTVQGAFDDPVGFGPIAPLWPERRARAPGAAGWTMAMWRSSPMPASVDPSFFNVAPIDQQVDALRPDEPILLEHLDREHARLITRLPGIVPRARIERHGRVAELIMVADTLWIDTDRSIATLTWRGHLHLESTQSQGRVVIGMEVQRSPGPRGFADLGDGLGQGVGGGVQAPLPATVALPSNQEGAGTLHPFFRESPALPFALAGDKPPSVPRTHAAHRPHTSEETQRVDEPSPLPVLPFPITSDPAGGAPAPPALVPLSPSPVEGSPWIVGLVAAPPPPQTVGDAAMKARAGAAPAILSAPSSGVEPVQGGASAPGGMGGAPEKPRVGSLAVLKKAPPPVLPGALSVAVASDAAAGLQAPTGGDPLRAATPLASLPAVAVELLWFDPAFADSIRKHSEWSEVIVMIKAKPRDADFADGSVNAKRQEAKDRREIAGVLARARSETADGLHVAFTRAIDEDGRFEPPLVMTGGELEFPFDELETLKATVAVVSPLVGPEDKRLKEILGAAQEALRSSWGHMAERLTEQLREALAKDHRAIPVRSIETHIERILLEGRHMQKRTLLGQSWIRATLTLTDAGYPTPAYLPAAPARELPALQRFPVRLIAEVRAQLDQYEAAPIALRVVALGRAISSSARR